tara:strand:+ start:3399 stop:3671 length:273 start_codon:yes stop_codon:yes gene_type:complete
MAREASSNAEIHMHELIRTNDPVLISFVESLMRDAGIGCMVADTNMSILDGSIGMLPRRIMVDGDETENARQLITDAGLAHELRPWDGAQ